MIIKTVTLEGFKTSNASYELGAVTAICAGNFTGKTAITDAIQIGLLGYHPRVGKTNASLAKFAGGSSMSVKLAFDNDVENAVTVEEKGGKVSVKEARGLDVPAVLMDVKEYFSLTGAARTKYVFDKAQLKDFSKETLVSAVDALEVVPSNLTRPIIAKAAEQIRLAGQQVASVPQWMDQIVAMVTGDLKQAKQDFKGKQAALLSLKHDGPVPKDCSKELESATKAHQELTLARDKYLTAKASRDAAVNEQNRAKAALESFGATETKLKQVESELAALPTMAGSAALKKVTDKLRAQKAEVDASNARLNYTREQAVLNRKIVTQKIADIAAMHLCDGCTAKLQYSLVQEMATHDTQIKKLPAVDDKASPALEKRIKESEAIEKQSRDIESKRSQLTSLRDELTKTLANAEQFRKVASATLPELAPFDVAANESAAYLASMAVKEQQAKQQAFATYHDLRQRRQAAEEAMLQHSAKVDAFEAILKQITATQKEVVASAFNQLLSVATKFTDGILKAPLCYVDGELGYMENGRFVSHETFSGTEALISYAGLSVALAQESRFKIICLDEMGRMTMANKCNVVMRLLELVSSGVIDQAILVDCDSVPYCRSEAVTVVEL